MHSVILRYRHQGSENLTPPLTEWILIFYDTMGSSTEFKRLWEVVKVLLVLSHGQASVERGFSVNKEVEVENQKVKSLVGESGARWDTLS